MSKERFWVVCYTIFPFLTIAHWVTLFTLWLMKIYKWQVTGKLCQPKERIVAGAPYDTRKYGKLPKGQPLGPTNRSTNK